MSLPHVAGPWHYVVVICIVGSTSAWFTQGTTDILAQESWYHNACVTQTSMPHQHMKVVLAILHDAPNHDQQLSTVGMCKRLSTILPGCVSMSIANIVDRWTTQLGRFGNAFDRCAGWGHVWSMDIIWSWCGQPHECMHMPHRNARACDMWRLAWWCDCWSWDTSWSGLQLPNAIPRWLTISG